MCRGDMTSVAGPPPLVLGSPPYATAFNAVALGGTVGLMLYGVAVHQTYRYYRLYPNDRTFLKVFVFVIFILETFHTLLWIIAGYHYFIAEPFNSGGLADLKAHWSVRLTVIATACAVCTTQCFYACRVYFIDPKYKWLVTPAVVILFVSKGFAIAAGISAVKFTPSIADFQRISWLVSVSYGLAGATDVTLASTLVFVFHRSRTGFKKTDSILDTLIIYTINTGVLTRYIIAITYLHAVRIASPLIPGHLSSIFSILSFIFALVLPGNLIYAGISIVGTKLYANSVLAVLNSRRAINSRFMDDFTSFDLPEISQGVGGARRSAGIVSSLVWNAPQGSTSLSDGDSTCQLEVKNLAADGDGLCDELAQGAEGLKSGLGK